MTIHAWPWGGGGLGVTLRDLYSNSSPVGGSKRKVFFLLSPVPRLTPSLNGMGSFSLKCLVRIPRLLHASSWSQHSSHPNVNMVGSGVDEGWMRGGFGGCPTHHTHGDAPLGKETGQDQLPSIPSHQRQQNLCRNAGSTPPPPPPSRTPLARKLTPDRSASAADQDESEWVPPPYFLVPEKMWDPKSTPKGERWSPLRPPPPWGPPRESRLPRGPPKKKTT